MPSQNQTAKKDENKPVKTAMFVVKRAIGVDASPEFIKRAEIQAKRRGMPFSSEGLTEMVFPAKKYLDRSDKKPEWKEGEPVIIELPLNKQTKALSESKAIERVWED